MLMAKELIWQVKSERMKSKYDMMMGSRPILYRMAWFATRSVGGEAWGVVEGKA